jgi:hypothetical protein
MFQHGMNPAQWEAWNELQAAEQALEIARMRFIALTNLAEDRLGQRHLALVSRPDRRIEAAASPP